MTGYAGTGTLVRLALRRDRLVIPLSVLALVTLAGGSAKTTVDLYRGQDAIDASRALLSSPAIVALYGPIANPDNPDSFAVFKTLLLGAVLVAVLAVVLVRRHTRTEEEAGRTELVGAGVVGPHAPIAAALVVAASTVVLTGVLAAASLVGAGLGAAGSLAFGLAWIGAGLVFAGAAAVAAQLTSTTRGCGAWALGALAVAYLLRAIGDSSTGAAAALTWLSPLGWAEKVDVFGANRYAVTLLPLAATVLLVWLAFGLRARRDLGAGLLPARPGPANAAASLSSPFALAWRLQRATLLGWSAAYLILGFVLGSVARSVDSVANSPQMQDLLRRLGGDAANLSDAFVVTELQFLAVGAAAYGISAALRLRSEEADLHTEQLLATSTTRRSQLGSHAAIALGGSALLMLLLGVTLAIGHGSGVARVLPSALATIPAVWVCVGLAVAIFGSAPRIVYAAWGLLALFVVVGELGDLLNLPSPVVDVSPFTHVVTVPGSSVAAQPVVGLLALAVALLVGAGAAYRRRDIG